ncbi:ABC transporter permease (plasmid) [Haloferax mediterranei ATCC 33500]|uniref:ABC transporter permease n=1 Tax=Haloferax mediterranei (strain ATCC 33500 / DSM 1411 / JCM 8866 / NBRC 14739 / NCIMB 2177 / R-4) TaxID=523841 RepID=I3R9K7_HALMT|nr:ABC transporter permease subunit [Haloferax mediterranei]AFK20917.1 putative nos system protein, ABC-type copper transport system, permease protein [Haloferax mediterranei ATCC 33500]AHZ24214.1 copper ABC transporter permease [Haloferax mediterranei ATCC 33500]EMA05293.1 putative nos system protein, ABC-type copper transport system, permease protein [Haloferax mediterranei ATCC 33500]MDX5989905.1 ABC transporter permease subunit [Haloferax mediterranei ATCC 33500]QCQ77346.1 ABC transporter 
MSVITVAKKDVQDAIRSWRLLGLVAAFVIFFTGMSALFTKVGTFVGGQLGEAAFTAAIVSPIGFLLPVIGMFIGYRSVVGERSTGSIKLLLSLPHTRSDVVLGKFIGRTAIVSVATVIGALAGGITIVALGGSMTPMHYIGVLLLALVLGAAFVSVSVGLSSGVNSESIVVAIGFGLIVLFNLLWSVFTFGLSIVLARYDVGTQVLREQVVGFISAINPKSAFSTLTSTVMGSGGTPTTVWSEWWFAGLVLLCWLVLPLAFGLWRFESAELS